ncbi:TetR/AcrR family transcriptional regulator [Paracoccus salsus]|uniref:TetR/AcrR family transcriptional regulator n=1 Tax=Paracoccus salsus TaxID=2911061 RepID=UPI001F2D71C5|nr:TetR/AcrR family transcriptional regulator [Paracoccus salsus]MCF3973203.1 TetR/AcrR family transcriptional regulator [Paracoccus salsus]
MAGRQSAEDRKAQIVAEMLRLADEIGPDRLSTTDVARAVGLSQPAIFRHFPSKGALWLAVAEDIAARLRRAWTAAEAQEATPDTRLKALIGAQLAAIAGTPALPSILFSRELQVDNIALRDVFRGLLATFTGRLVTALRDQQASGVLRRDIAAEDVAMLLTSLVQGVAIRWTLGARGFPLVEEGLRLFDLQMALLRTQEDAPDGHDK